MTSKGCAHKPCRAVRVFAMALAVSAGVLFFLASSHEAEALKITLKRIVFEGPDRTAVLTIINNANEEQVYRLGWRDMRMTEDRSLEPVKEGETIPGTSSAQDMIRYAPRRIVMAPGAVQQVRLMLRKPKDLAEGEYRSHFWIQPEAQSAKFAPLKESEKNPDTPTVQIKMLTGMTLPVFVRHGNLNATASITDAQLQKEGDKLKVSFVLHRDGNRSLYGDVDFVCTGGGKETIFRQIHGIAVYTEVSKRHLEFDGPIPEGGAAVCSTMKITYRADKEDRLFKGASLAEAAVAMK